MPKAQPLQYQAAEPAFLRRLKAGNAALDGRHNVQIPRARGNMGVNDRLNMKGEEGEDEPLVVDEDGNVVSRDEVERMERAGGDEDGRTAVEEGNMAGTKEEERVGGDVQRRADEDGKVSSGFGKKRKAVKVVGETGRDDLDSGRDVDDEDEKVKSLQDSTKDLNTLVAKGKEDARKEEAGKKTKRKKIKLSFDDPA